MPLLYTRLPIFMKQILGNSVYHEYNNRLNTLFDDITIHGSRFIDELLINPLTRNLVKTSKMVYLNAYRKAVHDKDMEEDVFTIKFREYEKPKDDFRDYLNYWHSKIKE